MAAENIKTFDMRDVMVCLVDDIIDSTYHQIVEVAIVLCIHCLICTLYQNYHPTRRISNHYLL